MSDRQDMSKATRRLDPEGVEAYFPSGERTEPLDYVPPWVVELRVVGTPTVFQVRIRGEVIIGRSDTRFNNKPDIDLEPHEAYQQGVSRRHALLTLRHSRVVLRDLESSNGTFINGRRLAPDQDYRLEHGDTLTIGKLALQAFFVVMPTSIDQPDKTSTLQFEIPVFGDGLHVLVVDSDVDVAQVIGSVLEQAGFRVTVVGTVADAMGLIDRSLPDVVMLEWMLPDMSGQHLVRYVRQRQGNRQLPVVVFTGATAGYQMGMALEAGADIFLSKPVGVDELMRGLAKITGQAPGGNAG